jgi:mannose-6-phosphate isomerase-like protein (cupin superfamily)
MSPAGKSIMDEKRTRRVPLFFGWLFSILVFAALVIAGLHGRRLRPAGAHDPVTPAAQEKLTVEPEPSYRPDAVSVRRHPEVDTDVFLYINHWRNSPPHLGHGGLIERAILTCGDPLHPPKKGAVLKYIKSYDYAVLEARTNTQPVRSPVEQAFFYVTRGTGEITAGAKRAPLEEGTAVFVPAGLEYKFMNASERPLEMILVTEDVAPGFKPQTVISVGSYHKAEPAIGHHWAHVARGFLYDVTPSFSNPMGFAVVSIDHFDIAQPHTHGPGTEEIWCQLRGTSLLFFGNRLLRQEPGEAFLIPPNNRVPHASINPTDEPMTWLYMGCQHEEDMEKASGTNPNRRGEGHDL